MQGAETPEAVGEGLRALIEEIGHQLPLLDDQRAGAELCDAPRLSPYELFRPNENALSRIIGDLLDPCGTHGQGPLFLNALLGALDLPSVGSRHRNHVRVRCEVLTSALPIGKERRRIDLVVETPAVLLGIENKPWAKQGRGQLEDYLCQLELDARAKRLRPVLVFLSDQEEASAQGKVVRMHYHTTDQGLSLHKVLSSTVASVQAPKARNHVENLIVYIEMSFGGGQAMYSSDKNYTNAIQTSFDKGGPLHKRALAAIMLSQATLHGQILSEVAEYIMSQVSKEVIGPYFAEQSLKNRISCKNEPWKIRKISWPENVFVYLSSDCGDYCEISFGIQALRPDNEASKKNPLLVCELRSRLDVSIDKLSFAGQNDWSPWFRSVGTRKCWKPESTARFVLETSSGRVADHRDLQELARKMVELVKYVDRIAGE